MMRRNICIAFLFLCAGCAFFRPGHSEIQDRALQVKQKDGISRKEAVLIAQQAVLQENLADKVNIYKPYGIYKGTSWEKDGMPAHVIAPSKHETGYTKLELWHIYFPGKKLASWWKVHRREKARSIQVSVD